MPRPTSKLTWTLLGLMLASEVVGQQRACYWPNGDEHETGIPCNAAAGGACCEANHTCLSNGLCWDPLSVAPMRASCPSLCLKSPDSGPARIRQCANSSSSSSSWTCAGLNSASCTDSFQLADAYIDDRRDFTLNGIRNAGSCPTANTTPSPSSSSPGSGAGGGFGGGGGSWPSGRPPLSQLCKSDGPSVTSVGVGVGVGLGIPLLLSLITALWFLHKAKRELAVLKAQHSPHHTPSSPAMYAAYASSSPKAHLPGDAYSQTPTTHHHDPQEMENGNRIYEAPDTSENMRPPHEMAHHTQIPAGPQTNALQRWDSLQMTPRMVDGGDGQKMLSGWERTPRA